MESDSGYRFLGFGGHILYPAIGRRPSVTHYTHIAHVSKSIIRERYHVLKHDNMMHLKFNQYKLSVNKLHIGITVRI